MKVEARFCSSILFWFLGHPEVYIIILPAMGMVSEVMSRQFPKPIFGYMAMVGSLFAIAILAFLVWAHHMFVTGSESIPGIGVRVADIVDRDSISHQSVQLA